MQLSVAIPIPNLTAILGPDQSTSQKDDKNHYALHSGPTALFTSNMKALIYAEYFSTTWVLPFLHLQFPHNSQAIPPLVHVMWCKRKEGTISTAQPFMTDNLQEASGTKRLPTAIPTNLCTIEANSFLFQLSTSKVAVCVNHNKE